MELVFGLYDSAPVEGDPARGKAILRLGEADADTLTREGTITVVRTVHANGSFDETLPIVYEGHGTLYNGDTFVETWRSLGRLDGDRVVVGAAIYKFDDYVARAKRAHGKTAYFFNDRGLAAGDTWLMR